MRSSRWRKGERLFLTVGESKFSRVTTTEKVARRVRLVVNGTSGHGSIPRLDNALVHLVGGGREAGDMGDEHSVE